MAEQKIKWTQQQRRAIDWRGSDMVVTASAGTGKTAVLSGRCVDIVGDSKLCPDVLSILVLTFTEAAAEQMRQRIAQQLKEKIGRKDSSHLRHQLVLLDGADIGTIHSFCKRIITQYFYRLGIDPTFGVLDGDEQKLLKSQILEQTISWAWGQSNLQQGLEELFYGRNIRDSEGFLRNIIKTSDFLDAAVSKERWLERVLTLTGDSLSGAALGQQQQKIVADKLNEILNQLRFAQKLYQQHEPTGKWAGKCEDDYIKPVESCVKLLKSGNLKECAKQIREFKKPVVRRPKDVAEETGAIIKNIVKDATSSFAGLSELAVLNSQYLGKMEAAVGRQGRVFIELVKKFDQLYTAAKQSLNCLDFADLEHKAVELLTEKEGFKEDVLEPSETAMELRKRYKYIFVDEYQDINPVQKVIIELLSGENNLFVVGDIKQSIYAFRGSEPKIFAEALSRASIEPAGKGDKLRVDLNVNWRSDERILNFVNKVFERIMTASIGNIDYDERTMLRAADENKKVGDGGPVVELHILDKGGDNLYSMRQKQAAMIARRIKQLAGEVEYRDIVILMRSPSVRVRDYVEILRLAGVPVICREGGGYFEATEISDILSLLKVLDNPQRDIEPAAVLRSPLFGLSDTELAKIKIYGRESELSGTFYELAENYSVDGLDKELARKLSRILEQISKWRKFARCGSLADLIWRIYRETGLLSFVTRLANGRQRRANLLKLHDKAIEFEGFISIAGSASIGRFVEFIEKAQQAGLDWSGAEPAGQAENAVRIMSIHKSKGLEFEVVFLAELDNGFNTSDLTGQCLLDQQSGLGLQIVDKNVKGRVDSLAHQVIAEGRKKTMLAEEMRILYVAMTRAKRKLILSGCQSLKHCSDIVARGYYFDDGAVPAWQVNRCGSHLEWVFCGLSDQIRLHEEFETGIDCEAADKGLFDVKVYAEDELKKLDGYIKKIRENKSRGNKLEKGENRIKAKQLIQTVKRSLDFEYKFGDVWKLPAKQSVTQLTHGSDEFVKIDYSDALSRRPMVCGDRVSPADSKTIGTVVHLLISRLDLDKPVDKNAVENLKKKLVTKETISSEAADSIDADMVVEFFESDLGKEVFEKDNRVFREWPFTFAMPVSGESVVVQGIIDMLIEKPDGLLVVDFKSDDVAEDRVNEKAELYTEQLSLYSRAAEAILEKKVLGKWLYFLRPGCAIEIK